MLGCLTAIGRSSSCLEKDFHFLSSSSREMVANCFTLSLLPKVNAFFAISHSFPFSSDVESPTVRPKGRRRRILGGRNSQWSCLAASSERGDEGHRRATRKKLLGNERMGRTSSSKPSSLVIDKALILCGRDGFKWFVVHCTPPKRDAEPRRQSAY